MRKVLVPVLMIACYAAAHAQWQPCGVAVCDTPGSGPISHLPEIAPDGSGGAYIVWRDARNGVDYDVYAQHVDSTGKILWQRNGIPLAALLYGQDYPMLCPDGSGGMFAAWEDSRPTLNDTYVFAQHVDASGNQSWPMNGVQVSDAGGLFVRMVQDERGGLIVGWISFPTILQADPYVQRLNSLGERVWGDSGVQLSSRSGYVFTGELAVATDGAGGAIVAWIEDSLTYAQHVDSSGQIKWQANGVSLSGSQKYARYVVGIASDMQGGALRLSRFQLAI